jgi:hypothetical protein
MSTKPIEERKDVLKLWSYANNNQNQKEILELSIGMAMAMGFIAYLHKRWR